MARSVYPSAPQNLRVQVAARRLTPAVYQFTIGNDYVDIAKSSNIGSDWVQLRVAGLPAIDVNATNRLEAVCTRGRGQQAVHLVFSVNGKKVAEATDTKNPYGTGTVGVFAATGRDAKTAAEAEFDDFVVTQV